MIVYRIEKLEDSKLLGPYHASNVCIWADNYARHSWNEERPNIIEDLGSDFMNYIVDESPYGTYLCAFQSMKDLDEWFSSSEQVLLFELDFNIVEIEVKEVHIGTKQVVFNNETVISRNILIYKNVA